MKRFIFIILVVLLVLISPAAQAVEISTVPAVETVENSGGFSENTGFRQCAENDNYIMLVEDISGIIALKNKSTGYIWYSSPPDADTDETSSELIKNEILSSNVLRYGIPEKRTDNNYLRSNTGDCDFTVSDIENGVRIYYRYSAGFEFPVEYVLESDCLRASLKTAEIRETNPMNIATEVTIMGSFGAGGDEDGYFVIPDGSGALIRFNSNRTSDTNAYFQSVYGDDITAVPTTKSADTQQIYFAMYGIVKEDNAMLVVAESGSANASISAEISGQSNSRYNFCRFVFRLRNSDTFYMAGSSTDKFTVFEQGAIGTDDIVLKYYPIAKKNADYIDIAEKYREYLMQNGLEKKKGSSALYIDFYGGAEKKKNILGIPFTMKQSITDYSQALEILTELQNKGADNLVVSYSNWTDDGIENKIDTNVSPSGTLGGKANFNRFVEFVRENNILFCPTADNRDFVSGNGYNSLNSTCIRVSGQYSRIVSYDRAYGIPDGFSKNKSLLSPEYFEEVFKETAENYVKSGLTGISTATLTTSLYGDYSRDKITRAKSKEITQNSLQTLSESLSVLADGANDYTLPYVSHITNMPVSSSRFDIFSEDIPFMQIVLHGIVPYTSPAVNSSPNPQKDLLKSAAMGCLPLYDLTAEETEVLKDTELDVYSYSNADGWLDYIAENYAELRPLYEKTADCTITDYSDNGDIITTSYSDGTVTVVNLDELTIKWR